MLFSVGPDGQDLKIAYHSPLPGAEVENMWSHTSSTLSPESVPYGSPYSAVYVRLFRVFQYRKVHMIFITSDREMNVWLP